MASQIVYVYGKKMCACAKATIPIVEKNLRAIGALPAGGTLRGLIMQGSYNTSVSASGSTHAGGGAIDTVYSLVNSDAKLKAWRLAGWAMWPRRSWEGPWSPHGHGIVIGCPHASASAKRQVESYRIGRNGLRSNAKDPGPRVAFTSWQTAVLKESIATTVATSPQLKELKMDANEVAKEILNYPVQANGKRQALVQHLAELFVATAAQSNAVSTEAQRDRSYQTELVTKMNEILAKLK